MQPSKEKVQLENLEKLFENTQVLHSSLCKLAERGFRRETDEQEEVTSEQDPNRWYSFICLSTFGPSMAFLHCSSCTYSGQARTFGRVCNAVQAGLQEG